jgi:hypothetical protein
MRALMKPNYLNIQFTHAFAAPPHCARDDLIC